MIRRLHPTEFEIQCAFVDLVTLYAPRYPVLKWGFAIPNGGLRPATVNQFTGQRYSPEAQKLKRMGVRKGPSDWFLPVRSGHYAGLFIEFKDHKGTLEREQAEFLVFVAGQGYRVSEERDAEEAFATVKTYLELDEKKPASEAGRVEIPKTTLPSGFQFPPVTRRKPARASAPRKSR